MECLQVNLKQWLWKTKGLVRRIPVQNPGPLHLLILKTCRWETWKQVSQITVFWMNKASLYWMLAADYHSQLLASNVSHHTTAKYCLHLKFHLEVRIDTICITIHWSWFLFDAHANPSLVSVCSAEEFYGRESRWNVVCCVQDLLKPEHWLDAGKFFCIESKMAETDRKWK